MDKANLRNNSFQKHPEELVKSMRDHYAVELRKKKRSSIIQKKRAKFNEILTISTESPSLEDIINGMRRTKDSNEMLGLLRSFKLLSSQVQSYSFSQLLDDELIHQFSNVLSSNILSLQNLAFWVLINEFYVSRESIERFLNSGILNTLDSIIKEASCPEIIESVIWLVGNIVSDNLEFRDRVIASSLFFEVIKHTKNSDEAIQRYAYWVLHSISCQKPSPKFFICERIFQTVELGLRSEDSEINLHCAWISFYLSEKYSEILERILVENVMLIILKMLPKNESEIVLPLLKVIGNAVGGTDQQTRFIVSLGIFPKIVKLINSKNLAVRREVFSIFGNMLASTEDVVIQVVSTVYEKILENLENPDFLIKKYSLFCVSNSAGCKNLNVFKAISKFQILESLFKILAERDGLLVCEALRAIKNFLGNSKTFLLKGEYLDVLDKFYVGEGLEFLDILSQHGDKKVANEARYIINEHFEEIKQDLVPVELNSLV